jgi:hypothetical protein
MKWFAFKSHGSPPSYGMGTVAEAQALVGMFNRDRAINHYTARELAAADVDKLKLGNERLLLNRRGEAATTADHIRGDAVAATVFVIADELRTHSHIVLLRDDELALK